MPTFRRHKRYLNLPELGRMVAFLLLMEAGFMLVPLVTAFIYGETDAMAFAVSIAITVTVSGIIFIFDRPRAKDLGKRDGILLTAGVWVVFSLFGMIPFMLSEARVGVVDAFFESMSGFTTTGASVLPDVESLSHAILIWRCMMQWVGGVGIVIFTIALLPALNSSGGMQMFNAELSGVTHDKLKPRISQTAVRLWLIYTVLTVVMCLALWIGPMGFFDSICHSFATVSTGGLSTRNASIEAWDSMYVRIVVLLFMFLGGVSFVLLYRVSMGKFKLVIRDENLRFYVSIIIIVSVIIMGVLLLTTGYEGFRRTVVDPLFQVVSLITSTGYTVAEFPQWNNLIIPFLLLLMFIGACAGSTSGGAKIDRIIYLWKNSRNELHRMVYPNRYYPLTVNGQAKSAEVIDKVTSFLWFYAAMIVVGGILLSAFELPLSEAFFASFTCLGNTGLGIGSMESSFVDVPAGAKIIMAMWMLIGRLEIFTVIILFTRAFWRK